MDNYKEIIGSGGTILTLIVMIVFQCQMYKIIHIKNAQLTLHQLYLNKTATSVSSFVHEKANTYDIFISASLPFSLLLPP